MVGVEVVPVVVNLIADLALAFVLAVARPWRYALSPTYRARIDAKLTSRGQLQRIWYLGWGVLAIALTALAIATAIGVRPVTRTSQAASTAHALRKATSAVAAYVEHRAGSSAASATGER